MSETSRLNEALGRIKAVFRRTAGVELVDTEVAELAGLDDEECRILLGVLESTGAIERPRGRIFVCHASSWWTSASPGTPRVLGSSSPNS